MSTTIPVDLGERSYDVTIGRGVLRVVGEVVPDGARRALVVTQAPVARHYLSPVEASLRDAGLEVEVAEVPDGELAKSLSVLGSLYTTCAGWPLRRNDVVVALGGGVVGDLAGFLAATWNRGVAFVQVPTTLLAQVDAAVGGKTAINLPEGKNLVGAFHQPMAVVADLDTLDTLDERVRVEGMAEIVKAGFIRDQDVLALLEGSDPWEQTVVEELVRRAVSVKAGVVAGDERESGERAHLNFGHTYGHALEAVTGYERVLHGEAVGLGMLVALGAGEGAGVTPPGLRERCEALLSRLGLPVSAPQLDRDEVWRTMGRDKKATDQVRFVLLEDVGKPIVRALDRGAVDAAIDSVEDGPH